MGVKLKEAGNMQQRFFLNFTVTTNKKKLTCVNFKGVLPFQVHDVALLSQVCNVILPTQVCDVALPSQVCNIILPSQVCDVALLS